MNLGINIVTVMLTAGAMVCSLYHGSGAEKIVTDPTGTWKIASINSETKVKGLEQTLKLKLEAGKLAGTITGRSSVNGRLQYFEWAIQKTKLQGNDISFTVPRGVVEGKGPDSTTVYAGKIDGDTIKGRAETDWSNRTFKRDFEARRVRE